MLQIGDWIRFDGRPGSGPPLIGDVVEVLERGEVRALCRWTPDNQPPQYNLFNVPERDALRLTAAQVEAEKKNREDWGGDK